MTCLIVYITGRVAVKTHQGLADIDDGWIDWIDEWMDGFMIKYSITYQTARNGLISVLDFIMEM